MTFKNIIKVDESDLGTSEFLAPIDLTDFDDGHETFRSPVRVGYVVKVVNDLDVNVDVREIVTTHDDPEMNEWDYNDSSSTTVNSGSPPDNVLFIDKNESPAYVGVSLTPASDPTSGEVKVIIEAKPYSK